MNVTRDVIIDLWPLYLAGEASDDSRRLVEEYLRQDPEFARLNGGSPDRSLRADRISPPGRENELATLRRTMRLVRIREALFWFALFLSAAPLTVYDTSWGRGSLIRDLPWVACGLAVGRLWCGRGSGHPVELLLRVEAEAECDRPVKPVARAHDASEDPR